MKSNWLKYFPWLTAANIMEVCLLLYGIYFHKEKYGDYCRGYRVAIIYRLYSLEQARNYYYANSIKRLFYKA